jgi:chaperonin cofactor prefoldin
MEQDEAEDKLKAYAVDVQKQLTKITKEKAAITETLDRLKVQLKAKFGDAINLEE